MVPGSISFSASCSWSPGFLNTSFQTLLMPSRISFKRSPKVTLYPWKNWLVVEQTPLINISQNGNLPQIGLKIKNIWNHHQVKTDDILSFSCFLPCVQLPLQSFGNETLQTFSFLTHPILIMFSTALPKTVKTSILNMFPNLWFLKQLPSYNIC